MLRPIAKVIRGASHVGGSIATGASGTVVVRAIDHMSFEIGKGARVGLVGHNGAGKTTLLRTIAGIYEPTGGSARNHRPRHAAVQSDGRHDAGRHWAGIHPHPWRFCLGLEPHQLDTLTEEVIEFCELGSYIDMPARTYSTGMLVRLAFALATSVPPDILLFDELIGAGDARFVTKAQERLQSFVERSNIVVVASHSRGILHQWCNRLFLIEHGKLDGRWRCRGGLKEYDQRLAAGKA